ncbi:hypothetical protein Tco_0026684 [Tanacetum coccineum]
MEQLTSVCDMVGQYIQKKEEEKRIEEEQAAKARYWKIPVCYDDDDDEERSIPLKDTIISGLPPDDKSFFDEDVSNEIYLNPLFDEEIISVKIDASIISMIDSLLEQFSDELAHNDLIPPGINEVDFDLEEDSHLLRLLDRNKIYDPGICIEVNSTRFLATLSPVIDTLIPFSSENDDTNFNHGVLASKKKSPPSSSHRGLKASKLFHHKSPMLIHGDNTPNLEAEHVKKAKRVKRPTKKSTTAPTTGVVIRDTPGVSVSKKKAPTKGDKGKGMKLLSDATLLEAAQVMELFPTKGSRNEMSPSKKTGNKMKGTGTKRRVPCNSHRTPEVKYEIIGVTMTMILMMTGWGKKWTSKGGMNDDKADSDDDGNSDADDNERTDSDDDDKNPSFTLKDYNEEEHEEEYESDDDYENMFEEEDDDLYKDVNVRSLGAEHEKERKGDEEMTDANQNASQEKSYEQVVEDAHVTLTSSQKTESSKQSSSVSSDFASKFLILENVPPAIDEVASMMNVKSRQEESSTQAPSLFTVLKTAIPETATAHATTVPPTISMITPLPQLTTPSPAPTTVPTTTSIPALPNFSSLFALQSYTKEFKKKAQEERKLYIDVVEKSVKDIIKDEVKSVLPQILPKEVSDFATPVIQSTITESLENVVLAKSSSQPQSTYEAAASLTEFELKKILLDKLEKSKSHRAAKDHRNLYDALVKSYQLDKDLFDSYGKAYSLKRSREDKDKDEDPPTGPDQGLKKKKTIKDAEPSRGSKSKESKSSSSKDSKSQSKSSSKSAQAEEPVFETTDTEMPKDQGDDMGNTKDQPNVEEASKHDCQIAKAEKPHLTFDELMSTLIDFSAFVMNHLKFDNLTQQNLVGPTFNLLKGTCKGRVELEYHFEESYKVVTDRLDWTNPEGNQYPFDLSKPLPLIEFQGRQVVLADYFINNDLKYLKGNLALGSKTTKVLWIRKTHDVYSRKRIIAVTHVKVMKKYDYGYLEEIKFQRDDNTLHKFKEGDFPNLNLRDIDDMLLFLIQKKISNLERDKKLNITKLETFRSDISKLTAYTAYKNPQGIIYQDKLKRNRLMRSNELYKLCDGTLTSVRRVLHDIASSLEMDYLPKRTWSKLDRKRSRIMIKAIDQQLFERRLMRNLEKFVGGREYGNDFRLLERTI